MTIETLPILGYEENCRNRTWTRVRRPDTAKPAWSKDRSRRGASFSNNDQVSDLLAVIDLRAGSPTLGTAISSLATGVKNSMPHHMEFALPPAGELLFLNAHRNETSLLLDVSNPRALRVARTLQPPVPLRSPHHYTRTPAGTRLVGFLRSEGRRIDKTENATPGNHGGIAEYRADGALLRSAIAGDAGGKPVPPCAIALLSAIDRLAVTSAPMIERVGGRDADLSVLRFRAPTGLEACHCHLTVLTSFVSRARACPECGPDVHAPASCVFHLRGHLACHGLDHPRARGDHTVLRASAQMYTGDVPPGSPIIAARLEGVS